MGPRACKLGLGSLASQHLDSPGKSTISSLGFHSVTLFLYFDGTDVFICSGSKGWRTGEETTSRWRLSNRCLLFSAWEGVNTEPRE